MLSYEGIAKNFRFVLAQVKKQLDSTDRLLDRPSPRLFRSIQSAENYIDTQKSMIEDECFSFIARSAKDEATLDAVRALNVVTGNLERISDFAVNISRQVQHVSDAAILSRFEHRAYLAGMREGLELIPQALFDRDSALALRICRIEDELDELYAAHFQQIIASLHGSSDVGNLITILFILHYLERMGDALLNIGEAILFAVLGERLKIHQYDVLDDALSSTPTIQRPLDEVALDSIWGTRSGVRIGKVEDEPSAEGPRRVLFKEGDTEKLRQEREALLRWESVAPGLVPQIVEYQQQDQGAALLLQYLDGLTFQHLLLNNDAAGVATGRQRLEQLLGSVWRQTRSAGPVRADYIRQLLDRIDDVYRIHPQLRGAPVRVGAVRTPAFSELLEQSLEIDAELAVPFSVFIHGDLNVDNILFDFSAGALHLVDVHRSRDMDYAQDVSVFLVSNFRLPVFVPATRRLLEGVCAEFLGFARRFAAAERDATFEARLALGLVRSFTTSTRFELNRRFAQAMHQRAVLLLERLLAHRGRPWEAFRLPAGLLAY